MGTPLRAVMLVAAAIALCATPGRASVIYSDLGPGKSFNCCQGRGFGGSGSFVGFVEILAAEFIPAHNDRIRQIDLALSHVAGFNDGARVSLWTGVAALPTAELAVWELHDPLPEFGDFSTANITIHVDPGIEVEAGGEYFIAVGPLDQSSDFFGDWSDNSQDIHGTMAFSNGGGWSQDHGSYRMPAFDVLSDAPEPATLALFTAGLAWPLRRRVTQISAVKANTTP
jgi:hypothetical protein